MSADGAVTDVHVLRSRELEVTVDVGQGADLTGIRHLATGQQLLWQHPDRSRRRTASFDLDSDAGFFDRYTGGIQELFPNAGPSFRGWGMSQPFHGEACRVPWVVDDGPALSASVTLSRSPFALTRTFEVSGDAVRVSTTAHSRSDSDQQVHWGIHPAFSSALIGPAARVWGPLDTLSADPEPFGGRPLFRPGEILRTVRSDFGRSLPLAPPDAGSAGLAYAAPEAGWFVLAPDRGGVAVGMRWPIGLLPALWLWQECRDPSGYPWWGEHHIVGVEPHSSSPSRALPDEQRAGHGVVVPAGEAVTVEYEFIVAVVAASDPSELIGRVSHPD